MKEKEYACSPIIAKTKDFSRSNIELSEKAIQHFDDKYDNYSRRIEKHRRSSSVVTSSDYYSTSASSNDSSGNNELLTEEERMKIDICFRGLKTQVYVSGSMANLYYGDTSQQGVWELRYTGIPVVILDRGETKSRNKRRIQILLAERGTCFTLWQDIIDNLSSYKVAGPAFHTMFLSSDHRKIIGLSFDSVEAADELWLHIDRLTSCPENISLSVPGCSKGKKTKKSIPARLPEKSNISRPCCFQHITNVHLTDRSRYLSMQMLLPVLPNLSPEIGTSTSETKLCQQQFGN